MEMEIWMTASSVSFQWKVGSGTWTCGVSLETTHVCSLLNSLFIFFIIDGVWGSSDERFVGTKHHHSFPKQLRKAGSRTAMLSFSDVGVRGVQYGLEAFIKAIFTSSIKIPRTRRNGFLPKI